VHAHNSPAGFSISDYAPKVRRAVADAGRYAALKRVACRLAIATLTLVASMTISAAEPGPISKCGLDVRILRIAQVSDFYPKFPLCMSTPFDSTVEVVVSTFGVVTSIHSTTIAGAPASLHSCVEGLVAALMKRSAIFSTPPQSCIFKIKVSGKP
jgi:hypothetical protein